MEKELFLQYSAIALGRAIKEGQITAVEATELVFDQISQKEKLYHSYITVDKEGALNRASEVQHRILAGELTGPLAGVPMAIKDNICTKGMRTTCGSKMLEQFVPSYSAHVVERLEEAGVIVIGKTNMDEFAFGSTTETSYFGPTCNPNNIEHVPGGSSGGSAAAVAGLECFAALGSDTGGSIRQPAAHCGVVGMKPTYGSVSRYGLIAYASSMDQIGPIGKTVEDCVAIFDIIAGKDDRDGTSVGPAYKAGGQAGSKVGNNPTLSKDVQGMRIAVPKVLLEGDLQGEIKEAVLKAANYYKKAGAIVEGIDMEYTRYAIPCYYIIACAEASSNLERFDGIKYGYRAADSLGLHDLYKKSRSEGFGSEAKRRILLGTFALSAGYYDAYYLKALQIKALIKKEWDTIFLKHDLILCPVTPTTAPKLGIQENHPMHRYLQDVYTVSANLAGLPGISIPYGKDKEGLPIGIQLMADCFQEETLFWAASCLEGSYS